jgi:outer membrane protein OmpA-like peptidoglycan-associated protein
MRPGPQKVEGRGAGRYGRASWLSIGAQFSGFAGLRAWADSLIGLNWRMKLSCAFGASLLLLSAVPAAATSYPGEEITVNPGAIGSGYLLYPGGKYGRHVGNLRQPGDRGGPIHLHMPAKHVATHVKPRPPRVAATPPDASLPAPDATPIVPAPVPAPHHRTAHATPPPKPAPQPAAVTPPADPNSLPEDSAARLFGTAAPSATPPVQTTSPPPKPVRAAAAPPPPRRVATATPPPARTTPPPAAGMRQQAVIPFAQGASSPDAADVNNIHALARTLNAALNGGATRVMLTAFGGPRGDKSSDSRRLSLKRALVVRELLIEDGVPSEKIDVRAMGGIDDTGAPDRVDVSVGA